MTTPLHNYLRTSRRRVGLSLDDVAQLLGYTGVKSATHTGRHEAGERLPMLHVALAYERIYGVAVKELYAGVYRQVEAEIRERARTLLAEVELLSSLLESDELIAVPTWDE